MSNVFDEMGTYWAEIADKNQTEKQLQFLKNHLKTEGYVLDLACGTGRHSIPLNQKGYRMVGLDVSVKLLRIAKKRSSRVEVVLGDMRHLPFKTGAFMAGVSMDTSFGYLPSEADDGVSLAEVRRVIFQHGTFVIDVFNREELAAKYRGKKQSSKWKEFPSFFLKQERTVSQSGEYLIDLWTIRDKENERLDIFEHSVRLYELKKLTGLLDQAGFAITKFYGSYEEENFSPNSPRLILLAQSR
jgi:ubiquinone/menaquinone biosynthesis C-methylase UbiE